MSFANFAKSLPPSLSLVGRTALITGSSSGIGRQTALHLARAGATVLCTDLQPEPLGANQLKSQGLPHVPTHELINTLGGNADFQHLNVSSESDFNAAIAKSVKFGNGRLDILVNNAGITAFSGGIEHESIETLENMMQINIKGVWLGTKLAIQQMMTQEPRAFPADLEEDLDSFDHASKTVPLRPTYSEQHVSPNPTVGRRQGDKGARGSRGSIIQIASIHGLIGGPSEPAYCASKGAVVNLTRQVACDYAPHRINVNAISPGYLAGTAMVANISPEIADMRRTYWPHQGSARDVANGVM
ncbi:related to Short-chain dehydrogenase/reductase [Melanopsichium pennsylvanicum]|uniref:Related to Short-chain dehydrogenase/reductase n=2 Tax=Melanopsichium pennsylvanicum TaxID=63383 RepID=A0AAJ5C6D6_9BASI|nr:related to Short-chain dehydrogenase/reductase [Melanopsichium pennsylvanicum 4]SNX85742.1 related to Short-chain dehydrogenase/reductase [Melanopsichium pennsylvanicum]